MKTTSHHKPQKRAKLANKKPHARRATTPRAHSMPKRFFAFPQTMMESVEIKEAQHKTLSHDAAVQKHIHDMDIESAGAHQTKKERRAFVEAIKVASAGSILPPVDPNSPAAHIPTHSRNSAHYHSSSISPSSFSRCPNYNDQSLGGKYNNMMLDKPPSVRKMNTTAKEAARGADSEQHFQQGLHRASHRHDNATNVHNVVNMATTSAPSTPSMAATTSRNHQQTHTINTNPRELDLQAGNIAEHHQFQSHRRYFSTTSRSEKNNSEEEEQQRAQPTRRYDSTEHGLDFSAESNFDRPTDHHSRKMSSSRNDFYQVNHDGPKTTNPRHSVSPQTSRQETPTDPPNTTKTTNHVENTPFGFD